MLVFGVRYLKICGGMVIGAIGSVNIIKVLALAITFGRIVVAFDGKAQAQISAIKNGPQLCEPSKIQLFAKLGCRCKSFSDSIPIDYVKERLDVVGATILVIQVVRVFPDIQAENRCSAFHQWIVLIWGAFD